MKYRAIALMLFYFCAMTQNSYLWSVEPNEVALKITTIIADLGLGQRIITPRSSLEARYDHNSLGLLTHSQMRRDKE